MKTAKKIIRKVIAERTQSEQVVTTIIDGIEETKNTAQEGDFIVKGSKGEFYVVRAEKMKNLYDVVSRNGNFFTLQTKPVEIECEEAEKSFSFKASWGEEMIAEKGDFLVYENGKLSYRIEREAFFNTYRLQ